MWAKGLWVHFVAMAVETQSILLVEMVSHIETWARKDQACIKMRPRVFFQINLKNSAAQRPTTLGHFNDSYTCHEDNLESYCSLSTVGGNQGLWRHYYTVIRPQCDVSFRLLCYFSCSVASLNQNKWQLFKGTLIPIGAGVLIQHKRSNPSDI